MNVIITNNIFDSNTAIKQGGAIKWTGSQPLIDNSNYFFNNNAIYGRNIATFPIRLNLIVYNRTDYSNLFQTIDTPAILNISSGNKLPYILSVGMIDVYGNAVIRDSG